MNSNARNVAGIAILLLGMGIGIGAVLGAPMVRSVMQRRFSPVRGDSVTSTRSVATVSTQTTSTEDGVDDSGSALVTRVEVNSQIFTWHRYDQTSVECWVNRDEAVVYPNTAVSVASAQRMTSKIRAYAEDYSANLPKNKQERAQRCVEMADNSQDTTYRDSDSVGVEVEFNRMPYLSVQVSHFYQTSFGRSASVAEQHSILFDVRSGNELSVADIIMPNTTSTLYRRIAQQLVQDRAESDADLGRQDPRSWNEEVFKQLETIVRGSDVEARDAMRKVSVFSDATMQIALGREGLVVRFVPGTLLDDLEGTHELVVPYDAVQDLLVSDLKHALTQ